MPVVNLYFVRHGETDYNVRDVLQGQCDRSKVPGVQDLALNEKGIEQALALCGLLKERKDFLPDIVLSSDLLRARQTAQIIADAFGIKVVTDKGVREMFFGADNDGLSAAEFKKKVFSPPITYFDTEVGKDIALSDGATLRKIHKSPESRYDDVRHPGGESRAEVAARGRAAIDAFVAAHPQFDTILIVTHGAFLRFLMPELGEVENAECIRVEYDRDVKKFVVVGRIGNTNSSPRRGGESLNLHMSQKL